MTPILITSASEMDKLASQLSTTQLIAVDTEFQRETTYYPQLALVQIATDNIVACIDPLAFDAKPALQKILIDDNRIKIFHSCSQDLEVLYYYLGSIPVSIYDTQIANALLSEHQQLGYAGLVEKELGIQLDKSQTRTNWLQRPLTEKQIQYAGDDVFYLYQLHEILDEKLQAKNRTAWFEEECHTLCDQQTDFQTPTDNLWKRVKNANRLPRKNLAIVQAIAIWRELLAQQKDKTRRKILSDDVVIQLAESPPDDINALNKIIDRQHQFSAEPKNTLFATISKAAESSQEEWPDNRFNALESEQKKLLKELQVIVNAKAEELGISSTLLFARKELEKLILENSHITSSPTSWRHQCIGHTLIAAIENAK